jgi:hypothetical protein
VSDADAAVAAALKDVEAARNVVSAKQIAQYAARLDVDRSTDAVSHAQTALELAESAVRAQASGSASVGQGLGPRSSATAEVARAVVDIVKITTGSINKGEGCAGVFDDFINSQTSASDKYTKEPGLGLINSSLNEKNVETLKAISDLPTDVQKKT